MTTNTRAQFNNDFTILHQEQRIQPSGMTYTKFTLATLILRFIEHLCAGNNKFQHLFPTQGHPTPNRRLPYLPQTALEQAVGSHQLRINFRQRQLVLVIVAQDVRIQHAAPAVLPQRQHHVVEGSRVATEFARLDQRLAAYPCVQGNFAVLFVGGAERGDFGWSEAADFAGEGAGCVGFGTRDGSRGDEG